MTDIVPAPEGEPRVSEVRMTENDGKLLCALLETLVLGRLAELCPDGSVGKSICTAYRDRFAEHGVDALNKLGLRRVGDLALRIRLAAGGPMGAGSTADVAMLAMRTEGIEIPEHLL